MRNSDDLAKLLPFGYLFLIVMGILKDSISYYQLGINILKFSTIMDILISPIAYITSNPIILAAILCFFITSYYLPKYIFKNHQNPKTQKAFDLKSVEGFSVEEKMNYFNMVSLKVLAVVLLSFFVGTGLASGYFTSQRMENKALKYNYKINFNDQEAQQVHLIGTNSIYYFYVIKGQTHLNIAPINSIKNVELLYKVAER